MVVIVHFEGDLVKIIQPQISTHFLSVELLCLHYAFYVCLFTCLCDPRQTMKEIGIEERRSPGSREVEEVKGALCPGVGQTPPTPVPPWTCLHDNHPDRLATSLRLARWPDLLCLVICFLLTLVDWFLFSTILRSYLRIRWCNNSSEWDTKPVSKQ